MTVTLAAVGAESIPLIAIAVIFLIFAATRVGVLLVILIVVAGSTLAIVGTLTTVGLDIIRALSGAAASLGGS